RCLLAHFGANGRDVERLGKALLSLFEPDGDLSPQCVETARILQGMGWDHGLRIEKYLSSVVAVNFVVIADRPFQEKTMLRVDLGQAKIRKAAFTDYFVVLGFLGHASV